MQVTVDRKGVVRLDPAETRRSRMARAWADGVAFGLGGRVARRWRALSTAVFAVTLGGAMGLSWDALSKAGPGSAGPLEWWAADRDAGQLLALDRNLQVLRRHPLEAPLELAARSDRRVWVVCAGAAGTLAPQTLRCLRHDATVDLQLSVPPLLDLDVLDGLDALVIELSGAQRRAARIDLQGSNTTLQIAPDLFCVTGRDGEVLVGTDTGRLELFGVGASAPTATRAFGGVIADLAPGPRARTWWVLDAHGGPNSHRVALLDETLGSVWERPAGLTALHLAPVPHAERVWIADPNSNLARRFGPGGNLEIGAATLSMSGADRGVARPDGSVIFATPGALSVLSADGLPLPGQGGFHFLVDVEAARPR